MTHHRLATRRRAMALGLGALLPLHRAWAHATLGRVDPPLAAPDMALTLHDGRRTSLARLLRGRLTVLQLMFTGCSATCPIQGAIFGALQARIAALPPKVQLLSLSIDPLGDDAKALAAWRGRFNATPRWLAGVPSVADVDRLIDFVRGRAQRGEERHTAQSYLLDDRGRLIYRFAEFAAAEDIAAVLPDALALQR